MTDETTYPDHADYTHIKGSLYEVVYLLSVKKPHESPGTSKAILLAMNTIRSVFRNMLGYIKNSLNLCKALVYLPPLTNLQKNREEAPGLSLQSYLTSGTFPFPALTGPFLPQRSRFHVPEIRKADEKQSVAF